MNKINYLDDEEIPVTISPLAYRYLEAVKNKKMKKKDLPVWIKDDVELLLKKEN